MIVYFRYVSVSQQFTVIDRKKNNWLFVYINNNDFMKKKTVGK